MATKSSIHIKPCNIASSEAHNRRTAEYMRHIGESRIYVVPELSTDKEQWINPDFGTPELRTIMTIPSKWSRKRPDVPCRKICSGVMPQRLWHSSPNLRTSASVVSGLISNTPSRWRDVHPSVKEYCSSDRIPHWLMYANSVKSVKDAGASLRYRFSCIKTKGIG